LAGSPGSMCWPSSSGRVASVLGARCTPRRHAVPVRRSRRVPQEGGGRLGRWVGSWSSSRTRRNCPAPAIVGRGSLSSDRLARAVGADASRSCRNLFRRAPLGDLRTRAWKVIRGDALFAFPCETAPDVVSYFDHIAVVTSVAERDVLEANVPAERAAAGDGAIGQKLTFRVDAGWGAGPGLRTSRRRSKGWDPSGCSPERAYRFVTDETP
jgi:hypothetical protein